MDGFSTNLLLVQYHKATVKDTKRTSREFLWKVTSPQGLREWRSCYGSLPHSYPPAEGLRDWDTGNRCPDLEQIQWRVHLDPVCWSRKSKTFRDTAVHGSGRVPISTWVSVSHTSMCSWHVEINTGRKPARGSQEWMCSTPPFPVMHQKGWQTGSVGCYPATPPPPSMLLHHPASRSDFVCQLQTISIAEVPVDYNLNCWFLVR